MAFPKADVEIPSHDTPHITRNTLRMNLENGRLAMPENPAPIITMSASDGTSSVLRKSSNGSGSAFQNDGTGFGTGMRSATEGVILEFVLC